MFYADLIRSWADAWLAYADWIEAQMKANQATLARAHRNMAGASLRPAKKTPSYLRLIDMGAESEH